MLRLPDLASRVAVLAHVGFLAGAGVIAASCWLLYDANHRTSEATQRVDQSRRVLAVVADVNTGLARGESAQRGFLLTGRPSFVADRDGAFAALRDAAGRFERLTADNPAQQQRVQALREGIEERIRIAQDNAARRSARGAAGGGTPGAGQQASGRIYALTRQMEDEELRRLDARRADEARRWQRTQRLLLAALLVSLAVLAPAYLALLRQVRRRERVEAQLRDLAESLPVTVYRLRSYPDGRMRAEFLARSAEYLRGVDLQAAREDAARVVLAPILKEDRPAARAAAEKALRDVAPFQAEYRVGLRDGSIRWVRSTASLRLEPDGSVLWHGYWVDITDRKVLAERLEQARIAADAANRAKTSFLAAMSHEIRTPMNGVLGMLELLALSRLDAEQRATLGVVRESAIELLHIIDDILDVSKIEAGQLSLHPQAASVAEVVRRAWRIYGGAASAKGLVLQHAVDERISPALWVDPLRLGQIINNFVNNALKFTAKGGVELRVELLEQGGDRERLRFAVKDSGIGISKDAQRRLFQPYAQAETDTSHHYGGTGLGLVICKRLAEMMGGTIEMDSEPGAGTTMMLTLWLPIADANDLPRQRLEEEQKDLSATLARRRVAPSVARAVEEGTLVLVVDDHPVNRALLVHQVNLLGYAAESADNGFDALKLWEQGRVALIVTDCNMPRMSGYDLSRSIRSRETGAGGARTPIIACTANALAGEAEICFAAGMDDYLVKPVQLPQLMALLDRWVPLPPSGTMPLEALPAPAEAPLEAPIDVAALAMFGAATPESQRRTLRVFRQVNDADWVQLRGAVAARDLDAVAKLAHRIKGAAKTVGARVLAEISERIERSGKRGRWDGIDELAIAFEAEIARVNRYLDAM